MGNRKYSKRKNNIKKSSIQKSGGSNREECIMGQQPDDQIYRRQLPSGPLPSGRLSLPSGRLSLPSGRLSGPLPSGRLSGPLPSGRLSGPLPSGRLSGPLPSGRLSGTLSRPFSAMWQRDGRLEVLFKQYKTEKQTSLKTEKGIKINLELVTGNLKNGVPLEGIISLFGEENYENEMLSLSQIFFSEISELLEIKGIEINFEEIGKYYLQLPQGTPEKILIEKVLKKLRVINKCVFEIWWKRLSGECNSELIMVAPGSTNVTSDWDVTIIPTEENVIELLRSMDIYYDIMKMVSGDNNPSEIYDYNVYFEGIQCTNKQKNILESLSMKCVPFHGEKDIPGNNNYMFIFPCNKETVSLEMESIRYKIQKTDSQITGTNNGLDKHMDGILIQLNELKEMYRLLYEEKDVSNAFYHYLQSRLPKSEAYYSYSAFFCVVIVNQMSVQGLLDTSDNIEWRLIVSAYENTVDGTHHLQLSQKNGMISYTDIIKYSKYLSRISETLQKSFQKMGIDPKHYQMLNEIIKRSEKLVSVRGNVAKMNKESIDDIVKQAMVFDGGNGKMKMDIIKQITIFDKMLYYFVRKDMDYGRRLIGIMSSLQGLCKNLLEIYIQS